MATGHTIEKRNHITGFKEEISKVKGGSIQKFFTWFNEAKDIEETFIRGSWDFSFHIAYPASKYIKTPENLTALEIGHGGGRLAAAASRHFNKVYGVDIHNENKIVEKELEKRGCKNIELLQTNGSEIPLSNNSIDFVYTIIVLQHVEKIEIFENYISETFRVLKDNGVAVIYFGREARDSLNKPSKFLYLRDRILEYLRLKKGFIEIPSKVNEVNLKLTMMYAKKICRKYGFKIQEELVSRRKVPDGTLLYGGQHGLVIAK